MTTPKQDADQQAFETIAHLHPHAAYASDPERFWQYFHARHPNLSREWMVDNLKRTENEVAG